jgi:hypothetical protein
VARPPHEPPPPAAPVERPRPEPARAATPSDAHTAPHDEIISVVRDLVERAGGRPVLIDTLAHALKARGFRRTPGSPRLITRLRRIRELSISPNGMISLVSGIEPHGGEPGPGEPALVSELGAPLDLEAPAEPAEAFETMEPGEAVEEGEAATTAPAEGQERPRRRSRRGGRRRRRRPASAQAAPA